MSEIALKIEGMSCQGCVKGLEKAFAKVDGLENFSIDLDNKRGRFTGTASAEQLIAVIEGQGFDAELADEA